MLSRLLLILVAALLVLPGCVDDPNDPFSRGDDDTADDDDDAGDDDAGDDDAGDDDAGDDDATPSECFDDDREEDDSLEQASILNEGSNGGLTACLDDDDWFSVSSGIGEDVAIDVLFAHAEGNINIALYDPDGNQITSSLSETDNEHIEYTSGSASVTFLQVVLAEDYAPGGGADYEITLRREAGSCADDGFEFNDTPTGATPLGVAYEPGLQSCPSNPDWYAVALFAGQQLDVNVAWSGGEGELELSLFDESLNALDVSAPGQPPAVLQYVASQDETVLFLVEMTSEGGNQLGVAYDLVVDIGPPTCPTDQFESNDSQGAAVEPPLVLTTGLNACLSDDDWYVVYVVAGEQIDATVVFDNAEGNVDLYLYDNSPVQQASSEGTGNSETVTWIANADGPAFVQVVLQTDTGSAVGSSYDLDLAVVPTVCLPDGMEPNDSSAFAVPVSFGSTTGLTACPNNQDWYAINTVPSNNLSVVASFPHDEGNIDITLFDASGNELTSSRSTNDDESLNWIVSAGGATLLLVELESDAGGQPGNAYELDLSLGSAACTDDAFEDNDSHTTAVSVPEGVTGGLVACPGDSDFFGVLATSSGAATIEVAFDPAEGDLDLNLRGLDGSVLATSSTSGPSETLSWAPSTDQPVYVEVVPIVDSGAVPGTPYELTLSGTNTVCPGDPYEPNQDATAAQPIADGPWPSAWACELDEDWYELGLAATDGLQVVATFEAFEGDIDLELFDASGASLAIGTPTATGEELAFASPYFQTVYLLASLPADAGAVSGNPYRLDLDVGAGACNDDLYEPNDSVNGSPVLTSGAVPDLHACPSGFDYFSVDLVTGDQLDVQLLHSSAEGDLDLVFLDIGGATIDVASTTTDDETLSYVATADQLVVIYVEVVSDAGTEVGVPYALDVSVAAAQCPSDPYEPNDSQASPAGLAAASGLSLAVCPTEDDWYAVSLAVDDVIEVDATWSLDEGDLTLALLDPTGAPVTAASGSESASLSWLATSAGDHLLHVALGGDQGVIPGLPYDLDVSVQSNAGCVSDAAEPNDGAATASPITGDPMTGLVVCPADDDWYFIDANAGDPITAEVIFSAAEGDLALELWDDQGVLLASADSSTDNELLSFTPPHTGRFFLQIGLGADAGSTTGTPYELSVSSLFGLCLADVGEPNDSIFSPEAVSSLPATLAGRNVCPGDEDWFEVFVAAGEQLTATADFSATEGNLDVFLYDVLGTEWVQGTDGGDGEAVAFTPSVDGLWYVRVFLAGESGIVPGNSYSITIGAGVPPTCPEDGNEPNDALTNAVSLGAGTTTDLAVCPNSASDWFEYTLAASEQLDVAAAFAHAEGDIDLHLFDGGLALLVASEGSSNSESLTWVATTPTTVFLEVVLASDSGGIPGNSYDLTATIDAPTCPTDGFEPNDVAGAASALAVGDNPGLAVCPTDDDFYAFALAADDFLEVSALFSEAEGALAMTLQDPSGATVASGASTTVNGQQALTWLGADPGLHVLQVSLATDSGLVPGLPHALNVRQQSNAGCFVDALEPDNDPGNATALSELPVLGSTACVADDDWYFFWAPPGDSLTVDAIFAQVEGDIDLALFDSLGTLLAESTSDTNDEAVSWNTVTDELLFVRVSLGLDAGATPGNSYALNVTSSLDLCPTDDSESNDSFGEATELLSTDAILGRSACASDSDWYSVPVAAGDLIDVDLLFSSSEGDLTLRLFDPLNTLWAEGATVGDDESIQFEAVSDGDWRIEVVLAAEGGGAPGVPYDLVVDVTTPQFCTADTYEPNDAAGTGGTLLPSSGSLGPATACPTDDDWFVADLAAGDRLEVDAVFSHAEGNIDLQLVDAGELLVASAASTTDNESLNFVAPVDGVYYLGVVLTADAGSQLGNDYTLTTSITPSQCWTDSFEPNDSAAAAVPLPAGSHAGLSVCPGEDDWYALDVAADSWLDVVATFSSVEGAIDLELYDPTGALLAASAGGASGVAVEAPGATAGTYALRVIQASEAGVEPGSPYGLDVLVQPASGCLADAYEPNDSGPGRPLDASPITGLQACVADDDRFQIWGVAGDPMTVEVVFDALEGDIDLAILDAGGDVIATGASQGSGETILFTPTDTSIYTVRVSLLQDAGLLSGSPYVLSVDSAAGLCLSDSFEPDDSFGAAVELAGPTESITGRIACPTDEDWFSIPAASGDQIDIDLSFVHAEGDLTVRLFGPLNSLLAEASSSTDDEVLSITTFADGDHRIQVELTADAGVVPGNTYSLDVSAAPIPFCNDDALEPNDAVSSAFTPAYGTPVAGLVNCPGSPDYFEFPLLAGERLELELTFAHSEGDLTLELVDTGEVPVATSATVTNDEFITFVAPQDGLWYGVVNIGTDPGDLGAGYELLATVSTATCFSDAFEANDSPAAAATLPPGLWNSLAVCAGDDDWYGISLAGGDVLDVLAAFPAAEGDLDLELLDPAGAVVATANTADANEALSFLAPTPGTYLLHVAYVSDAGPEPGVPYTLDVTRQTNVGCVADAYEPNDQLSQLATLPGGSVPGLTICPAEDDWYSLSILPGDTLTIDASFVDAEGDIDLILMDASGLELMRADSSTDDEQLVYSSVVGELLVLRVELAADAGTTAGNAYDLSLGSVVGLCLPDGYEPNESLFTSLELDPSPNLGLTQCPGDEDWFFFPALAGDLLEVAIDFVHAEGDLDLLVYAPNGNLIAQSTTAADQESVSLITTTEGPHFAQVVLAGDTGSAPGNAYDVTWNVEPFVPCLPDAAEPNEALGSGEPLVPSVVGNYGVCPGGDEDWFYFPVSTGDFVELDLQFAHSEGNLDLQVFDSGGALRASASSMTDGESLSLVAPADDTWWVRVILTADSGALPGNTYDLSLGQSPAACIADGFEPNDGQGSPATLGAGAWPGLAVCTTDDDWYAIDLTDTEVLELTTSFDTFEGDIDLTLYDPSGTVRQVSSTNTGTEVLDRVSNQTGTWVVHVELVSDSGVTPGVPYDLDLLVTDNTGCLADGYEPNNALESARGLGVPSASGLQICAADDDWYLIDGLAGVDLTLDVVFADAEGDIDIALFAADGTLIAASTSDTDNEQITHTPTIEGALFLEVVLAADAGVAPGNSYQVDLTTSSPICVADAFEPNEGFGEAAGITAGTYSNLTACPGEEDWYLVELAADDRMDIDVLFAQADGDVDLFVHEPAGNLVTQSTSQTNDEQVSWLATQAGLHIVRVVLAADSGTPGNSYVLEADVNPAFLCPADDNEPNDSLAGATDLATAATLDLKACPADSDWYELAVPDDTQLSVSIFFDQSEGDLDLTFWEASPTLLAQATSATDDESLSLYVSSATTVFVEVSLFTDLGTLPGNSYDLAYTLQTGCPTDALEPNDSLSAPVSVSAGSHPGLHVCSGDDDYYGIDASAGDALDIVALFDETEGDLDLHLFDPSGALVASSDSSDSNESLLALATVGGTWVVQVEHIANGGGQLGVAYELVTQITPNGACAADSLEPNDERASAASLGGPSATGLSICPADDDYYVFSVLAGHTITVDATFAHAEGDIDLELFDSNGVLVGSSASTTDDEQVVYSAAATGPVTVRVTLATDAGSVAGNGYSLSAAAIQGFCADDTLEPNDAFGTAVPLPASPVTGLNSCGGDDDYYLLPLAAGEQVAIDIEFLDASGNLDVFLYEPDGDLLASGTSLTDDESVAGLALTSGDYRLQVVLSGDDQTPGNGYSVSYSIIPAASCPIDPDEPNNVLSNAVPTLLPANETGFAACPGDPDWYEFNSGTGDRLDIAVLFEHAEGDIDIALYDAGGVPQLSATSSSDDEVLSYVVPHPGPWFLEVVLVAESGFLAGNRYDLQVDTGPAACAPDGFEDNDTQTTAATLVAGDQAGLTACPADDDWYAVSVQAGQNIDFYVSAPANDGDLDVYLYDPSGSLVASAETTNETELVSALAATSGTWTIEVALAADPGLSPGTSYDVSLILQSATGCSADPDEPNDSQPNARGLSAVPRSLQACVGDDDWYFLDLAPGVAIDVSATFSHAEGDIDLALYDELGDLITSSQTETDDELVSYVAGDFEAVYIQVSLGLDAGATPGNAYVLDLSSSSPICLPDALEPNDSNNASSDGTGGLDLTACPGNDDWFGIDALAGDQIDVEALFVDAEGDINVVLMEPAGNIVALGGSTTDNEVLSYIASADGTYLLRVLLSADAGSVPGNSYDLAVDVAPAMTCPADSFEPNDDATSAASFGTGTVPGLSACSAEDDYYRISAVAGQTLTVGAAFAHLDGDINLFLLDDLGNQLSSSTSLTDNEAMTYGIPGTNTYYVLVVLESDAGPNQGNAYSLTVTLN